MLLSAADEYITAARGIGSRIARDRREVDVLQYHKLMSTALGCIDTVLKNFNMLPRDEAKLRLRYASLLIDETDNTEDIEEVLSKQINLCERCRLQDLKYATFHLQARWEAKRSNTRAALKSLDKPIAEAETFQHIPWVYAFRFLRVSLALQAPGRTETVPALQQLHAILAHAEKRGDRAVYVACSALEAMVHLRSSAADRLEQAQRAIAAARSQQLEVSAKQLGFFGTLIDILDVTCGLQQGIPDRTKSSALGKDMEEHAAQKTNLDTGIFTVLIERSPGGNLTSDSGGVFRKSSDGRDELVFAWLPKEDIKTLCFHISGLDANVQKEGIPLMTEAHQRSRDVIKRQPSYGAPLSVALARQNWIRVLDWHSIFSLGLMACYKDDQSRAQEALAILRKRTSELPFDNEESFVRMQTYLSAVIDQLGGSLDAALAAYSSEMFSLPEKGHAHHSRTDISILAALNRLLIVRDVTHPQHRSAATLFAQVRPLSHSHSNQYIRMALRLIEAFKTKDVAITQQKTLMQSASNRARDLFGSTGNREFVVMALNLFTSTFFAGQVGSTPLQAIRATVLNSKNFKRPLWVAVASGLRLSTSECNGLLDEVQKAQEDFEAVRPRLPLALRFGDEELVKSEEGDDVDAEGDEDDDGE